MSGNKNSWVHCQALPTIADVMGNAALKQLLPEVHSERSLAEGFAAARAAKRTDARVVKKPAASVVKKPAAHVVKKPAAQVVKKPAAPGVKAARKKRVKSI